MIYSGGRGFKPNAGPNSMLTANPQMDLGLYFVLKLTAIREDLAYRARTLCRNKSIGEPKSFQIAHLAPKKSQETIGNFT